MSPLKRFDLLVAVLALLCAGHLVRLNYDSPADDFASIYFAARLMADGKTIAIYDHHPYLFHIVPPGEFTRVAEKNGFTGFLHPYVHLPLVAYLFRPFLVIPYRTLTKFLLGINLVALMLSLCLIIRLVDAAHFLRWFGCALLLLCFFYPLRYSLGLGQTTPLVFLAITLVLFLSHNGYLKTAGVILGGIISLKITPLLFLVYFLIRKKWPLIFSTVVTVMIGCIGSIVLAGWECNRFFFQNLVRLSGMSLASWNNQSLDGFLLRLMTRASHIYDWHLLELSLTMRVVKYFILISAFLLWLMAMVRSAAHDTRNRDLLNFSLTLILMVVFTPISWSHYYLFLVLPYMVLVGVLIRNTTPHRYLIAAGVILLYPGIALPPPYFLHLLNVRFLNTVPVSLLSSSTFFSGILLMIIFLYLNLRGTAGLFASGGSRRVVDPPPLMQE